MSDVSIESILLEEIRENRREIRSVKTELVRLDKDVFANKVKLGIVISGISLTTHIVLLFLTEKIKSLFI